RIRPPVMLLSPPFMAFCTALLRTSSRTRSKGANCPTCRLPVSRSSTIRNPYTTTARTMKSVQCGTSIVHMCMIDSPVAARLLGFRLLIDFLHEGVPVLFRGEDARVVIAVEGLDMLLGGLPLQGPG